MNTDKKPIQCYLPKSVDLYEFEERAAIKEHCGLLPRKVAEAQAFTELNPKFKQQSNLFTDLTIKTDGETFI